MENIKPITYSLRLTFGQIQSLQLALEHAKRLYASEGGFPTRASRRELEQAEAILKCLKDVLGE